MGTFIVGAIVAVMVFLAGRKIYRDKKKGLGCGCGGCTGCSGCPNQDSRTDRRQKGFRRRKPQLNPFL